MPGGTDPQLWLSTFKRGDKETFLRTVAAAVGEGSVKFSGQNALVCIKNVQPGYRDLLAPRNGKTIKGQQTILRLLVEGAVPFPGAPDQVQLPGPIPGPDQPPSPGQVQPPSPGVVEGNSGNEPLAENQDLEPAKSAEARASQDQDAEVNKAEGSVSGEKAPANTQGEEVRQSRKIVYLELVKQLSEVMARYEVEIGRLEIDLSKLEEELGDEQISNDEVLASARAFSKVFKRYRARKQQLIQLKQTMSDCQEKIQEKLTDASKNCNLLKNTLQKAYVQVNVVKDHQPDKDDAGEPATGPGNEIAEKPTLPSVKRKRRARETSTNSGPAE